MIVVLAGEYVIASVAENFVKKVLGGRVKLDIVYGSTEVGMISDTREDMGRGSVKTGECGRLYPGLEMKVGLLYSREEGARTTGDSGHSLQIEKVR